MRSEKRLPIVRTLAALLVLTASVALTPSMATQHARAMIDYALGEEGALVQHADAVGEVEHVVDVVADEEDADPLALELPDLAIELPARKSKAAALRAARGRGAPQSGSCFIFLKGNTKRCQASDRLMSAPKSLKHSLQTPPSGSVLTSGTFNRTMP